MQTWDSLKTLRPPSIKLIIYHFKCFNLNAYNAHSEYLIPKKNLKFNFSKIAMLLQNSYIFEFFNLKVCNLK